MSQTEAQLRAQFATFNPQSLPFIRNDAHLPTLASERLQAAALRARFAQGSNWQPAEVIESPWFHKPLVPSAVLIPLVQRDELQVLLTERSSTLANHSGQIAFAGGRQDASDADAIACALREAQEEIGLHAAHVEVLGTLPTYLTGTAFSITPVVALVQPDFNLQINPHEVASAFEIPLAHLLNPANHHLQEFEAAGRKRQWFAMPSVDEKGLPRYVWGASAGMLRNLYEFLLA